MRIRTLFIPLIALVVTTASVRSEGVRFFSGTWKEALEKARTEKKMLLVDAYTDWCSWCKEMDKRTFSNDEVGAFVNRHFIAYKLDMEKGFGIKVAMKYRVSGFPTFLYFTSAARLAFRSVGFQESADYLKTLADAVDPAHHMKHPGDPAAFDLPWPDFYVKAFATGKEKVFPKPETVAAWLDAQSDDLSEVVWDVLMRFELNEKHGKAVIDNRAALAALYGKLEVEEKIGSIVYARAQEAIKAKDREAFARAREFAAQVLPDQVNDMLPSLDLRFNEETEDWNAYAAIAQQVLDRSTPPNPGWVNSVAWTLYEKCDNPAVLQRALRWMQEVTTRDPQYMFIDTQAALLFKLGQYDEAETVARWAVTVGKKSKENVGETEKLIEKIREAKKTTPAR